MIRQVIKSHLVAEYTDTVYCFIHYSILNKILELALIIIEHMCCGSVAACVIMIVQYVSMHQF